MYNSFLNYCCKITHTHTQDDNEFRKVVMVLWKNLPTCNTKSSIITISILDWHSENEIINLIISHETFDKNKPSISCVSIAAEEGRENLSYDS